MFLINKFKVQFSFNYWTSSYSVSQNATWLSEQVYDFILKYFCCFNCSSQMIDDHAWVKSAWISSVDTRFKQKILVIDIRIQATDFFLNDLFRELPVNFKFPWPSFRSRAQQLLADPLFFYVTDCKLKTMKTSHWPSTLSG